MSYKNDRSIDEQMDSDFMADLLAESASGQPPLLDIRQPAEPKLGCALLIALQDLLPQLAPAQA